MTNKTFSRIAIGVEYDGERFCGWQSQHNAATVQDALESALGKVANHPVGIIGAGRTDTGVHASCQVAHFDAFHRRSLHSWVMGGNTGLPPGVSILWAKFTDPAFHARFSAESRKYRYVILNRSIRPAILKGKVTWIHRKLNASAMGRAARALIGRHDFSAYRASHCQAKSPIRDLSTLTVTRRGNWIWVDVQADGFLHHMVRNIAGTLLAVGDGSRPESWVQEVLESRQRIKGGVTAPPDGLYLTGIQYPLDYGIPQPQHEYRFW